MRVRVHCITVIPVSDTEWTQYEVTDVNGNIEVAAQKNDVRIVLEGNQAKTPSVTQATGGLRGMRGNRPAGAVGTGILICLLAHCFGGGSRPVSPSQP
jgi:hypothetical protein